MARYLVASGDTIVGDVEAKTMKSAILGLGRVGTFTLYRVESQEVMTLKEVVRMAVEVEGNEEE